MTVIFNHSMLYLRVKPDAGDAFGQASQSEDTLVNHLSRPGDVLYFMIWRNYSKMQNVVSVSSKKISKGDMTRRTDRKRSNTMQSTGLKGGSPRGNMTRSTSGKRGNTMRSTGRNRSNMKKDTGLRGGGQRCDLTRSTCHEGDEKEEPRRCKS